MPTAGDLFNHAKAISELACGEALKHFRQRLEVEFKADESPVTLADRSIEQLVRDYIRRYLPQHGIFGEEFGRDSNETGSLWIIDPIDGTRSFLSGHPLFGFLLAYCVDEEPKLGVITMPALEETYIGGHDHGASLNGVPISTSDKTCLQEGILYINEGEKIFQERRGVFSRLMHLGQTRRFAYDCYPHALLAAGHVDAVVDYDLQPYDYMAVSAVIRAAGGIMTDWDGKALSLESNGAVVSAASKEIHEQLLTELNH